MDPTANLAEQVRLAKVIASIDHGRPMTEAERHDVDRLAELVLALDVWMQRRGFTPEHLYALP